MKRSIRQCSHFRQDGVVYPADAKDSFLGSGLVVDKIQIAAQTVLFLVHVIVQ